MHDESSATIHGYYQLLAEMIKISRKDARRGNQEAVQFLQLIGAPIEPVQVTSMRLGSATAGDVKSGVQDGLLAALRSAGLR